MLGVCCFPLGQGMTLETLNGSKGKFFGLKVYFTSPAWLQSAHAAGKAGILNIQQYDLSLKSCSRHGKTVSLLMFTAHVTLL